MKILFVDGDSSALEQAENFLEDEDARLDIEKTISAEKGLELLKETDFDAIVSSYQLTKMDGLEFFSRLLEKKNKAIPHLLFLLKKAVMKQG